MHAVRQPLTWLVPPSRRLHLLATVASLDKCPYLPDLFDAATLFPAMLAVLDLANRDLGHDRLLHLRDMMACATMRAGRRCEGSEQITTPQLDKNRLLAEELGQVFTHMHLARDPRLARLRLALTSRPEKTRIFTWPYRPYIHPRVEKTKGKIRLLAF